MVNAIFISVRNSSTRLPNKAILNMLNLVWGVQAVYYDDSSSTDKNIDDICSIIKDNFEMIILCHDKSGYLLKNTFLEKIFNKNNIQCFIASSVQEGVEELEKYNDNYVKIIFGSHYIAEEVYNATGKHFDTTNN